MEELKKICYENYDKDLQTCIKYTKEGLKLYPDDVDFNYIMSIKGFYSGDKDLALKCCQKLILSKDQKSNTAKNNISFFNIKLNTYDKKCIDINEKENFNSFNPSICSFKDKFYCIVRTCNYYIDQNGKYIVKDNNWENQITINYLLEFNKNLNILSKKELIYKEKEHIEDCRLFVYNNELHFTATNFIKIFSNFKKWIALFKIKDNEIIKVKEFQIESICEKNWLPFYINNKEEDQKNLENFNGESILLIKNHNPLTILKYENNEFKEFKKLENKFNDCNFRGGAPPIIFNDGYLYIVHEVYGQNRNYYHRFVYMNKNLEIKKLSGLFKFNNERIEFCAGICQNNDEIILSYGIMDKNAYICKIKKEEIKNMLFDLN